jgi:segregation and condensation protein B
VSDHLKPVIEALIFASPEPITLKTLCRMLDGEPKEDVEAALAAVRADYDRPGGLQIVEVAGGYQLTTRPELHEWVRKLFHERTTQKLSVQALETLAVIAYKQPISRSSIASIRAVNVDSVVRTLLGRGLITEVDTDAETGAILYGTTELLLTNLGLNALDELPPISPLLDGGQEGFPRDLV